MINQPHPVRSSSTPTFTVLDSYPAPGWLLCTSRLIVGRPAFISFQTVAELRLGALLRNWGEARLPKLDARIAAAETVHTGPDLVATYARLRVDCERNGHALAQRQQTLIGA